MINFRYCNDYIDNTEHYEDALFSLLEGASKPIDNDEEESYKAAFAGDEEYEEMRKLTIKTTTYDTEDSDDDNDDVGKEDGDHDGEN